MNARLQTGLPPAGPALSPETVLGEVHYATVTSSYYVVSAVAQVLALAGQGRLPLRYHALCMDRQAHAVMAALAEYGVRATYFEDFEDDALRTCKTDRTLTEYCWTIKPPFLLALLQASPEIGALTFLDADIFPFAGDDSLLDQLCDCDVVLFPHRFPESLHYLDAVAGRYNAGMISFRNTPDGRAALSWWRDRSLEWCYHRDEDGKLGDQKYLLHFQGLFRGVEECRDKGYNVGPWSVGNYRPYLKDGQVFLEPGVRLRLYHFHQYRLNPDGSYVAASDCYPIAPAVRRHIYEPFHRAVREAEALVRAMCPGFIQPR